MYRDDFGFVHLQHLKFLLRDHQTLLLLLKIEASLCGGGGIVQEGQIVDEVIDLR